MLTFTLKQKKLIAKNIRAAMESMFPGKGRGRRMARLFGVSPSTVSQWVNGKKTPTLSHLYQMSKVFGTPLHQLCGLPKRGNIRTKNLVTEIIKRIMTAEGKRGNAASGKRSRADMNTAIMLIKKELEDIKEMADNDE